MPLIERNNFLKFNPRNALTFIRWKSLLSRFLIQRQSHCGAISTNLSVSKKEEKRSEFHGRFFRGRDEIDWDACYACCNRFPDDIALRAIIRTRTIISRIERLWLHHAPPINQRTDPFFFHALLAPFSQNIRSSILFCNELFQKESMNIWLNMWFNLSKFPDVINETC